MNTNKQTLISSFNGKQEYGSKQSTTQVNNSLFRQRFGETEAQDLNRSEFRLRELWSQYMNCLEKGGLTAEAQALKEEYFALYRNYRHDKKWRELLSKN